MAVTVGKEANTNGVHAGGPMSVDQAKAASAITPGALVVRAADGTIQEAGAAATGVLGYALENDKAGKAFRDDWATDDFVPYNQAPGARFMGMIKASSAALVAGDLLKTAANGELEKLVVGTDEEHAAVARYVDADFTPGASVARKIVKLLG